METPSVLLTTPQLLTLSICQFPEDESCFYAFADYYEEIDEQEKADFYRKAGKAYSRNFRVRHAVYEKMTWWYLFLDGKSLWLISKKNYPDQGKTKYDVTYYDNIYMKQTYYNDETEEKFLENRSMYWKKF